MNPGSIPKYTNGNYIYDDDMAVIIDGHNKGCFGKVTLRGAGYETVLVTNGGVVRMEYPENLRKVDSEDKIRL